LSGAHVEFPAVPGTAGQLADAVANMDAGLSGEVKRATM
jgi:hypothetical protein